MIQEFRNFDPATFGILIFDPSDFEILIQILDPPFQGPSNDEQMSIANIQVSLFRDAPYAACIRRRNMVPDAQFSIR